MSSEYDEIDALLGDDSLSKDLEDAEIAELDAILGSINEDNFLSEREEVFLANKNFLHNNTASVVDKTLMAQQEKLMDQVEDILEEYSGGCMTGEHYGLDEDHDLLDEMEFELDLDSDPVGNANLGYEPMGDDDIFGLSFYDRYRPTTQAERMKEQQVRQAKTRIRRRSRVRKREGFVQDASHLVTSAVKKGVSDVEAIFSPKRRLRRRRRSRPTRRLLRRDKAFRATRSKYIRLAKNLKKACYKFRRLQIGKTKQKNLLAIAPGAMAVKPFSIASAAYVSNFPTVASTVSSSLSNSPMRERRQTRRREAQILKAAKACDAKYDRLVAIWKKLSSRGSTAGLQSPREIVSQGFGWMKKSIKNAQRKVRLSQQEKSVVRRNRLLEKRRLKGLRAERKQLARIQQKRRAAIALRRKEMEKQRQIELKRQAELKKRLTKDAKKEARAEYDALSAMSSYIDEADLKALERASLERKMAPVRRSLPPPALSMAPPVRRSLPPPALSMAPPVRRSLPPPALSMAPVPVVRRRRRTTLPRPRFSAQQHKQINAQKTIRQEVARRLRLGGTTKSVGLYKLRKHPAETLVQFEVIRTSFIQKLRKNQRKRPVSAVTRRPMPHAVSRPIPRPVSRPIPRPVSRPMPHVVSRSPVRSPKPQAVVTNRLVILQKRKANTTKQLDKAVKLHKKALDAKRKAENAKAKQVVITIHYQDVKKHASAATKFRQKLVEIEKQIKSIM